MTMIYLDHAATTPVRPEVLDAMLPYFTERFGNPSSVHRVGLSAAEGVAHARRVLGELVGLPPSAGSSWVMAAMARIFAER